MRGLYDYPKFSSLLNQPLSPDIQQVAYALARKFNLTDKALSNQCFK
jgi:hypothetical protein